MNFNVYAFIEVCVILIPLVVVLSVFLSSILVNFARKSSTGMQVLIIVSYLLCIGVIVHEAAHRLFCELFGIKVRKTNYFSVEHKETPWGEYTSIGGYIDCEEVNSVIACLFLGIAPLIINGLLVSLLYYYSPIFVNTPYFWLFTYLGVALGLGARPSTEDLKLWITALKKAPSRGLLEISLLCFFGITIFALIIYQINVWIVLSVTFTFLFVIIIQGRSKSNSSRSRYFPRT